MALVHCYNRGCGQMFNPRDNQEEGCIFHPGAPYFHETYKGWSCCGKKSSDFTTFLGFPGCTKGQHSNVKPEEPEAITGRKDDRSLREQVEEAALKHRSPEPRERTPRPEFEKAKLVRLKAEVASSLKAGVAKAPVDFSKAMNVETLDGEPCKNGGCKAGYGSPASNDQCKHHPGVPIFHEGMKYWSCCQRKTSDFQSFLNQEGCTLGEHRWKKNSEGSASVECRYDWHQTATHVTVAIYAKKYDPEVSFVEVSPVRLKVHLYFPEQGGAFDKDMELKGLVDVNECTVLMAGTKAEVKMRKAEPGSWSRLDIPRPTAAKIHEKQKVSAEDVGVDALDLDDLDFSTKRPILSSEASGGRTSAQII